MKIKFIDQAKDSLGFVSCNHIHFSIIMAQHTESRAGAKRQQKPATLIVTRNVPRRLFGRMPNRAQELCSSALCAYCNKPEQ